MFKLPYKCAHFTCWQGYTQNSSSKASPVHELRTSRCTNWVSKWQKNQRSNCQHSLDQGESKGVSEKIYFCYTNYTKAFDCMDHNKLRKILKRQEYQSALLISWEICMWVKSNSYNWTWWGWWGGAELDMKQMDWFKTGKAVRQGCILSPCLFNLYCRVHHEKCWTGRNTSWNQDCWEKYQ